MFLVETADRIEPVQSMRAHLAEHFSVKPGAIVLSRGVASGQMGCLESECRYDGVWSLLDRHPLVTHYARTRDDRILAPKSTARSGPEWPGSWDEIVHEAVGGETYLSMPLPAPAGQSYLYILGTSRRELTWHRSLLSTLMPLASAAVKKAAGGVQAPAPQKADSPESAAVGGLTRREQHVLELLAQSLTADAMAHRLDCSKRTVHKHLQNIYRKLGTADRLQTVLTAQELGLIRAPASHIADLRGGVLKDGPARRVAPV